MIKTRTYRGEGACGNTRKLDGSGRGRGKLFCNSRQELLLGMKAEKEHAHLFPKNMRLVMAKRISLDHLKENKCYYTNLKKLERRFK